MDKVVKIKLGSEEDIQTQAAKDVLTTLLNYVSPREGLEHMRPEL